ncbi:MAG: hypothetical protein ABWX92_16815 [Mycetocola sp.]
MSDPIDDNADAPDEALIGPGSTATGGGTSQDPVEGSGEDDTLPPLDPDGTGATQLADERFRHPDL